MGLLKTISRALAITITIVLMFLIGTTILSLLKEVAIMQNEFCEGGEIISERGYTVL